MNSTHYRLKTPTLAILTSEDKKIPVTIPHGSTVELIDGDVIGTGWFKLDGTERS